MTKFRWIFLIALRVPKQFIFSSDFPIVITRGFCRSLMLFQVYRQWLRNIKNFLEQDNFCKALCPCNKTDYLKNKTDTDKPLQLNRSYQSSWG